MSERSLPEGWEWAELGTIADVRLGKMLSPKAYDPGLVQLPYLRNENVRWFRIDTTDLKSMGFGPAELARYAVGAGDLLVCEGGEPGRSAVVPSHCDGLMYQKALHRVRPVPGATSAAFLQYAFRHFAATGSVLPRAFETTIRHLPLERMVALRLPLPPLAEQHRIVAKIEELFSMLDAGVAALERVRTNLKRYRASVLKAAVEGRLTAEWRAEHPDAESASTLLERIVVERRAAWERDQLAKFAEKGKTPPANWRSKYREPQPPDTTDLPALPGGWVQVALDQLASQVRNGLSPRPANAPPGLPILRISAVRPMSVDLQDVRYLDMPAAELATYHVATGDLLFTRYNGSLPLVGVAGMVRGSTTPTLHPDKLIRCRLACPQPLPAYVEIAANTAVSRQHMVSRARTTAGQTGVSGQDVRDTPVPLPPLAEQAEIVAEVERRLSVVAEVEAEVEAGLKRAARLRQAILKRAFEGKLVPQHPNDEPASVALERAAGAAREGPA